MAIILFLSRKGLLPGDLLSLKHKSAFFGTLPPPSSLSKQGTGHQSILPSDPRCGRGPKSGVSVLEWGLMGTYFQDKNPGSTET